MPDFVVEARPRVYRKAYHVKEKQTGTYTFTIRDEAGAVVPAASLDALTLTLHSVASGAIVNGRNAQNALNANNVTVSAGGVVTWTQQVADVAILDSANDSETHRALFLFTWTANGHARSFPHEMDLVIENLVKLI